MRTSPTFSRLRRRPTGTTDMKRGQVFTFAGTNAPRAGMTISETLFMSPEEHAHDLLDRRRHRYQRGVLYASVSLSVSSSGETRVEAPSLRVLPEGSALLIPQKTPFRVLAQDPCVFLEIEAKEGFCMNLIKTDEVFALKDLLPYEKGKIVNADIVNNPHMKMALMSFDAGCATPEHARRRRRHDALPGGRGRHHQRGCAAHGAAGRELLLPPRRDAQGRRPSPGSK